MMGVAMAWTTEREHGPLSSDTQREEVSASGIGACKEIVLHPEELKNDRLFHLIGWVLFLLCALCFLVVSLRERDGLSFLASLLFLGGCVMFIIPLIRRRA